LEVDEPEDSALEVPDVLVPAANPYRAGISYKQHRTAQGEVRTLTARPRLREQAIGADLITWLRLADLIANYTGLPYSFPLGAAGASSLCYLSTGLDEPSLDCENTVKGLPDGSSIGFLFPV
jgi:hypothetical protein